jgi:transposase-like protein
MKPKGTQGKARSYERAFKERILSECALGERSYTEIAQAHGVRVGQLYKWRHQSAKAAAQAHPTEFKRIELNAHARQPQTETHTNSIRIELTRAGQTFTMHWPLAHANSLMNWLVQR